MLWLGLGARMEEMQALAAAAEGAARRAGFPAEGKPFVPHLTLSRIRPPQSVTELMESSPPPDVEMPVREVVLFRSVLGRGPARYEPLERFVLVA